LRPSAVIADGGPARRAAVAALLALLATADSVAAHDRAAGRIDDARGEPVGGALVTVTDPDGGRATTVYTDALGRFMLPELARARYDLRARHPDFRELLRPATTIGPATALPLRVERAADPAARAAALPPSHWTALVLARLSSQAHRAELLRQCTFCHQLGSPAVRRPRDAGAWRAAIDAMAPLGGRLSPGLAAELPVALAGAYDAAAAPATAGPAPEPPRAAVVTEWVVGEPGTSLHDVAIAPDGAVFAVDMMHDRVYRLDPASGARTTWEIPAGAAPGGVFAATELRLPAGATAQAAPESLRVAADGTVWVALAYRGAIGRLDPVAGTWTIDDAAADRYPQTLRLDPQGRVWYTLALANAVAVRDPATGAHRTFQLPTRSLGEALAAWLWPFGGRARLPRPIPAPAIGPDLPFPSGLAVASDGAVWFSQIDAHRIGRLDPASGGIRTWSTPFPGPRDLALDAAGGVWVAGFETGVVARFDALTGQFQTWMLPVVPPGTATPYALCVDRRTDAVWLTGTGSDTLIRFERWHEQFTVAPLPTRGTAPRRIACDDAGTVWTASAAIPPSHAEDPRARFVRVSRDGP